MRWLNAGKYKCLSKADQEQERHVHGGMRGMNIENKTTKRTKCNFIGEDGTVCNLEFTTYYKLRKHKTEKTP